MKISDNITKRMQILHIKNN